MSSVVLVIFMLVIILCSDGDDSLLIRWIVMLYPHDYVDIMFMHCNLHHVIFIMAQHICIQVNRIKLNLNNCWLSHGATTSS